jgi:hypothetical protein
MRYDEHFLADPPRNIGECLEGPELFTRETARRRCETLPRSVPAHVISPNEDDLVTASISAQLISDCQVPNTIQTISTVFTPLATFGRPKGL